MWLIVIQSVLLRYHALTTLRKAFVTAGRAVVDNTLKDVLKQAKAALHDKSLPVQRAAAEVCVSQNIFLNCPTDSTQILVVLYPSDDTNRAVPDVEYIVTTF